MRANQYFRRSGLLITLWVSAQALLMATTASAVDAKAFTFTEQKQKACQKVWPAPCNAVDDKTGEVAICLSQPKRLRALSNDCFGVVMEVATWAPKQCSEEALNRICKGEVGAYGRLDCAAFRAAKFPKSCGYWLEAAGNITKEYRRRTAKK